MLAPILDIIAVVEAGITVYKWGTWLYRRSLVRWSTHAGRDPVWARELGFVPSLQAEMAPLLGKGTATWAAHSTGALTQSLRSSVIKGTTEGRWENVPAHLRFGIAYEKMWHGCVLHLDGLGCLGRFEVPLVSGKSSSMKHKTRGVPMPRTGREIVAFAGREGRPLRRLVCYLASDPLFEYSSTSGASVLFDGADGERVNVYFKEFGLELRGHVYGPREKGAARGPWIDVATEVKIPGKAFPRLMRALANDTLAWSGKMAEDQRVAVRGLSSFSVAGS